MEVWQALWLVFEKKYYVKLKYLGLMNIDWIQKVDGISTC